MKAPPLPGVPLLVLLLAILVELLLYYGNAPEMHLRQRIESLAFLAAPDQLILLWCGEKLAYFSLLDRWPIVLLTAVILAGAWLAGRLLLLALGVQHLLTRLERHVFAVGTGLNLLSIYALAVGLAGGLQNRWLFVLPLVALAGINALLAGSKLAPGMRLSSDATPNRSVTRRDQVWSPLESDNDPRWLWLLLVTLPFALIMFLGAMLPPWDYDVREYHLQAPKEWYQNGRIAFLSHNIYANMPLGSELTGLWAMAILGSKDGWWWGALVSKTVMACYSFVTAAGLIAFGRRLHSLAAGVVSAVIYIAVPWTVALATAGYNEGPVGMHALLAIFAIWLACRRESPSDGFRLISLAGFCAGSAVACKYPPLLFLVFPLALFVIGHRLFGPGLNSSIRQALVAAIFFLLAACAACGLWFAKNAVQTDNPTYPLLYSVFDGRTRTPEKHAQWKKVHSPQPDESGRRFTVAGFAGQLAWNGWRTLWASLAIPPLAVMGVFYRRRWQFIAATLTWMVFVFVAWWLSTHRLDRFLVLLLPMAALLASLGALALPQPLWRGITLTFIGIATLAHFPFITLHPDNRYFAPLEMLRRDDRELGVLQGHRVDVAKRWLNEYAKTGEKVLMLGDAEPFDLEIPTVYNTCFDDCQFTRIFRGRSREERLALLREENIAYIFCSWAHLARYRSPGNYGYTSDYPTRELVHSELIRDQRLLIPIATESDPQFAELFRVADE